MLKNLTPYANRDEIYSEKRSVVEGYLFTSLYEGFSDYSVNRVTLNNNTAEVVVNLHFNSLNNENWQDTLLLKYENGWKVHDIIFSDRYTTDKTLRMRLARMIREFSVTR